LLRPAPEARPSVWAATLGADLSSLSDGATRDEVSSEPVAVPVAVSENESSSEPLAVAVEDRQSLGSVLEELMIFDGSIGVALVDSQSGMVLGEAGSANNLELSAAGASVILRARQETNKALGSAEEIGDVLITLSSQVQIVHPLSKNSKLFLYLIGDKTKSSLAMARYKAAEADELIRL
jgi:predicted regulator of Ras-like GTPase activity (Roadblock/LC7/MglB family)